MKKMKERPQGRWFFLLLLCFLWGGIMTANAEKKAWVKYDDSAKTLTFYYSDKGDLGENEYEMNTDNNYPEWCDQNENITRVVFDPSFADAHPTSCFSWFHNGYYIESIEGIQYLNTTEVTNMSQMFNGCKKLTTLDISHFSTSKVTDMSSMFRDCNSLTELDLYSFDTSNVTDMSYMFIYCSSLKVIYASDKFKVDQVTNSNRMFGGCYNLKGDTGFSAVFEDKQYAKTDRGYFIDKNYRCPWVGFADGILTFHNDYKKTLGKNEHWLNEGGETPFWNKEIIDVKKVVFDASFADVRPTTCCRWFYGGTNIETIEGLQYLNMSDVSNVIEMFSGCSKLTQLDLSNFNTSKANNLSDMFRGCSALTELDLSNFDTSNARNMNYMFFGCATLTRLDLSSFNTSSLKEMNKTFSGCTALTRLDLSSFDTSKLTSTAETFYGCSALKEIYVSDKFTTSAVYQSNGMFSGCTNLKGDIAYDETKTDVSYATINNGYFLDGQYLRTWVQYADNTLTFHKGYKKTTISSANGEYELNTAKNEPKWLAKISNVTKVVFDPSFADARPTTCYYWFKGGANIATVEGIEYLNTSKVTDMAVMFSGCSKLTQLDLSHFDTSNVTNMCAMFSGCSALTSIDVSKFNTANVTAIDQMFRYCSALSRIDLSSFNTAKAKDFEYMFSGCSSLTELDLSKFDTSSLENIYYMFCDCSSLTKLTLPKDFNTSKATNMQQLFKNCSSLTELNLPKDFNTSNVQYMTEMFMGCSSLTNLDLSSFNTAKAVKMESMFRNCSSLANLDLSSFNTSNVTNMLSMFSGCSKLTKIVLSSFDTSNVTDMGCLFYGCSALTSIDLSSFNTSNATKIYSMFNGCTSLTSLDLSNFDTQNVTSMSNIFSDCSNLQSLYLGAEFKKVGTNAVIPSDMSTIVYSLPSNLAVNKTAFSGVTVKPYVPINVQSEYGTICVPLGSKLTADSYTGFDKLYTVKAADATKGTVTLTEATSIEPGVAYVYHRALADDATKSVITFEADDNASTVTDPANDGNLLKGTFERITAPGGSYILQTDGNFHPVAAGNTTLGVGAYRAYLDLSLLPGLDITGDVEESNAFRMVFDNQQATAITGVSKKAESQPKAYFDLSGRKVANPQRGGIYINNGRKVVF